MIMMVGGKAGEMGYGRLTKPLVQNSPIWKYHTPAQMVHKLGLATCKIKHIQLIILQIHTLHKNRLSVKSLISSHLKNYAHLGLLRITPRVTRWSI